MGAHPTEIMALERDLSIDASLGIFDLTVEENSSITSKFVRGGALSCLVCSTVLILSTSYSGSVGYPF